MIFYLTGIDYKTSSLSSRERIYRRKKEIEEGVNLLHGEVRVLFTCNRIELYGLSYSIEKTGENISRFKGLLPEILGSGYEKRGKEAFLHILRLVSGLESQLVGERQILKQINSWMQKDGFPEGLKGVWEKAVILGEEIRKASGIDEEGQNIAGIIFNNLVRGRGRLNILIIGTGKVARLFSEEKKVQHDLFFVSRKKHSRASKLAEASGGKALWPEEIPEALMTADIVVSASGSSPHYILNKDILRTATYARKKELYVYDLAVPRDVELSSREIPGVKIFDLEDFTPLFEAWKRKASPQARKAEELINEKIKEIYKEEEVYAY